MNVVLFWSQLSTQKVCSAGEPVLGATGGEGGASKERRLEGTRSRSVRIREKGKETDPDYDKHSMAPERDDREREVQDREMRRDERPAPRVKEARAADLCKRIRTCNKDGGPGEVRKRSVLSQGSEEHGGIDVGTGDNRGSEGTKTGPNQQEAQEIGTELKRRDLDDARIEITTNNGEKRVRELKNMSNKRKTRSMTRTDITERPTKVPRRDDAGDMDDTGDRDDRDDTGDRCTHVDDTDELRHDEEGID